jgi:hypothetical protein
MSSQRRPPEAITLDSVLPEAKSYTKLSKLLNEEYTEEDGEFFKSKYPRWYNLGEVLGKNMQRIYKCSLVNTTHDPAKDLIASHKGGFQGYLQLFMLDCIKSGNYNAARWLFMQAISKQLFKTMENYELHKSILLSCEQGKKEREELDLERAIVTIRPFLKEFSEMMKKPDTCAVDQFFRGKPKWRRWVFEYLPEIYHFDMKRMLDIHEWDADIVSKLITWEYETPSIVHLVRSLFMCEYYDIARWVVVKSSECLKESTIIKLVEIYEKYSAFEIVEGNQLPIFNFSPPPMQLQIHNNNNKPLPPPQSQPQPQPVPIIPPVQIPAPAPVQQVIVIQEDAPDPQANNNANQGSRSPKRNRDGEDEEDVSSECVICMDSKKNYLIEPCMHLCICSNCVDKVKDSCPVCRGKVTKKTRIFI